MKYYTSVFIACITICLSQTYATTVFEDDFSNNIVTDSQNQTGFWTQNLSLSSGDANAITESAGTLMMTAGSNDGTNDSNYASVTLYSAMSSSFNFFDQELTMSVRGITCNDHGTAIADSAEQIRFILISDSANSYAANDAIVVKVTPAGSIRLGIKEDDPTANSDGNQVFQFTGLGTSDTYGFDLTITPASPSNQSYRLEVFTGASPVSAGVQTGSFSLDRNNWNGLDGNAILGIWTQEGNVTGGSQYYDASVTNITVQTADIPMSVVSLTLVDADNNTDISAFSNGNTIDLQSVPTRNLSIRANTIGNPDSVSFHLNDNLYHVEDNVPFSFAGHSNGNHFAWTPNAGSYSLSCIPYSGTNGTGSTGTPLNISFNVTDDYAIRVGSITINAAPGTPLQVEQVRHDFIFGSMIKIDAFNGSMSASNAAIYKATFISNFNYSVHGNVMKWYSTEPDWWKPSNPDSPPRWDNADLVLDWCESNSIPMRGHTLFWGANHSTTGGVAWTPDWVEALSNSNLLEAVKTRATNTTERFAGRINEFDFNNEMTHGNFYKSRLGWAGVSNMAVWAKQGNPNCTLYANDFNVLNGDTAGYVSHINALLSEGISIDGVGCQGHFSSALSQNDLTSKLDTLATLNMPILVTEYDCNTTSEITKRDALENLFRACFAHENVRGIIQWGFWEGAHWRPDAALWNTDWSPTLAADKYRDLVFGEWWTSASGQVPSGATYPVKAFLGTYVVTIDGKEHTVVLTPEQNAVVLIYNGSSTTTNYPVQVSAGSDIELSYPTVTANLNGEIISEGTGAATSYWSQVSGPGTVTIESPYASNTTVTVPSIVGSYVLRFSAADGSTSDYDDISVTLLPPVTNIITNAGFETGTTDGWTTHAGMTLSIVTSEAQEGSYSCRNSGRDATYDGVAQELNGVLENGKTYVISAWVKLESLDSHNVSLKIKKTEDGNSTYQNVGSVTATNSAWTRISGEYTLSTTGSVSTLLLYMDSPPAGATYWADTFSCYEGTQSTLDSDMDTIPDEWEWTHFGSIGASAGQSNDDADGDGFTDLQEYFALTDPNDPQDVFEIDTINVAPTNTEQQVISWYGAAGRRYSILSTTNITNHWNIDVAGIQGQNSMIVHTNSHAEQTIFYRLKVDLDN